MSEERTGPQPGEPDDLELDEPDEELEDELEPEPDDTDPEPEPGAEPEPQPRSRSQQRITRQQRDIQDLREQNRRLTEALTRQPAQPQYQPPQPDPARQAELDRQERDRVAQMPFEDQILYWRNKDREESRREAALNALQTRDMLDQANFRQIMREKHLPAKYANEVESLLSQARQQQMNPSREMVLQTVIGREVLERKDRETERQRQRGQRRIASQTTRPGGASRSTAAVSGGRRGRDQDAEDEALLRGITVGDLRNLNMND